jgi:phosphoesterase RecJ-like protein
MAAELIEAGVSPAEIHRRLYEGLPFARTQLLARALSRVQRFDDGAVTLTHLTRDDFTEANALETDSEGIVDHLRAVENTAVAVLVRDLLSPDRAGWRKASLRATDDRVDVSRIARGLGGGGHRQAAGFSTQLSLGELAEQVRAEVRAQLSTPS